MIVLGLRRSARARRPRPRIASRSSCSELVRGMVPVRDMTPKIR